MSGKVALPKSGLLAYISDEIIKPKNNLKKEALLQLFIEFPTMSEGTHKKWKNLQEVKHLDRQIKAVASHHQQMVDNDREVCESVRV